MRFARQDAKTLQATERLLCSDLGDPETRQAAMERWVSTVSRVYGVRPPKVVQPSAVDAKGVGTYLGPPANEIHLQSPSVMSLATAFRGAHQRAGASMVGNSPAEDAEAWASSLIYRLRPHHFDDEGFGEQDDYGAGGGDSPWRVSTGVDTGGASEREAMAQVAGRIQAWSGRRITQRSFEFYRDASPGDALIVTVTDAATGEPVGTGGVSIDGGYAMVVVDPRHRGRGVGTTIITRLAEESRRHGILFNATVAADNPASRRVMEKAGLVVDGVAGAARSSGEFEALRFTAAPR